LNTEPAPRSSAPSGRFKGVLLVSACVLALATTTVTTPSAAAAKNLFKHKLIGKQTERASKLPFGDIPKGPLAIYISIDQQKLHFYSGGVHVLDAPVATGVPGRPTPLGVFSVIQRDRYHHSNIYDNAPMPYMERITWSGVALHEGPGVGHRASHGCIRMPGDFAARLWMLPTIGMRVIIAGPELRPIPIADPHLFAHSDAPPSPGPAVLAAKTAQKVDPASKTDVVAQPSGTKPADTASASSKEPTAPSNGDATQAARSAPTGPAATETTSAPALSAAASDPAADVPLPPVRPAKMGKGRGPIAIFISRKTGKIYVRQDFTPVFDAPVKIDNPGQPIGTHVFTALDYLPDHSSLRWTVVSLPGTASKVVERWTYARDLYGRIRRVRVEERAAVSAPPPETPQQALARIEIPQDVIDQISQLIVPGSSLIVSDQGLGSETGEGTDFIVVTR
jgi:hypothetical protein